MEYQFSFHSFWKRKIRKHWFRLSPLLNNNLCFEVIWRAAIPSSYFFRPRDGQTRWSSYWDTFWTKNERVEREGSNGKWSTSRCCNFGWISKSVTKSSWRDKTFATRNRLPTKSKIQNCSRKRIKFIQFNNK